MIIREMSRGECLRMLARTRLVKLGCAKNNQPYVVPISLAYHHADGGDPCLYGVTTLGQKVEWMRVNPLVCVEVDEVAASDRWASVIAFGRYEELPETPEGTDERFRAPERSTLHIRQPSPETGEADPEKAGSDDERLRAFQILKNQAAWWEPGWAAWVARAAHRDPTETYKIIYYKINIDSITGHESTRDAKDATVPSGLDSPGGSWGWLRRQLARLFGGNSNHAGTETRAPLMPCPHHSLPTPTSD